MFLLTRLRAGAPQILLTVVVFALASGILGGLIFYVDNSTSQVFREVTADVPVDLIVDSSYAMQSSNVTIYDIRDAVEAQELVNRTTVISYTQIWGREDTPPRRSYINTYLGIESDFFEALPRAVDYPEGNGPLLTNSCWVSSPTMTKQGLEVGDNYTVHMSYWNGTDVEEFFYDLKIAGVFTSELFKDYYNWNEQPTSTLSVIMSVDTFDKVFSSESNNFDDPTIQSVWASLDKSSIIQSDPMEVNMLLNSLEVRIEQNVLPYASIGWGDFPLRDALQEYITWASSMRLVSFAFSIPTILMGIMLVNYDAALGADEIRRDSGTLKTRGASGRQVFLWIMARSTIISLMGGLGAILTGVLSSYLAGTVRTFLQFDLTRLATLSFYLDPVVILFAFAFSFVLGLFVSFPIAYKSLIQTISESHQVIERQALMGQEFMKPPVADILFFAVTFYCVSPLILFSSFAVVVPSAFFALLMVLVPILLILILTSARLASRPTSRIKAKILSILQFGRLSVSMNVLSKAVRLHKKTEASAVMFIAMVFAASTLTTLAATTGYNHMESLFRFEVGADISLDVAPSATNVTLDLVDAMRNITGVAEASGLVKVIGNALYRESDYSGFRYLRNRSISVWGVEPASWVKTAFLLPYFTRFHDPGDAFNQLAQSNASVISSFRPVHHYQQVQYEVFPVYYNNLTVELRHTNKTLHMKNSTDCTIVDVMTDESGYITYFPGRPIESDFIMMNLDYVVAVTNKTQVEKFYVSLEPGANITQVKQDLIALSPKGFSSVLVVEEYIDEALESRAGQVVYGIYTLDVFFAVVFLSIGTIIVTTLRTRKMRRSFSILRALGAETEPMIASLMLDTFVTLAISLLIGSILGLFLGYAFSGMQLVYTGINSSLNWGRLPVEILIPLPLIGGIVGFAFLLAVLANYFVDRHSLSRNIAEEIQYSE